jgi:hypothetical protein
MSYNYMSAIGEGFPNTQASAIGNGNSYEDIVYEQGDPIPSKEVLDNWIISRTREDMWELIKAERDRRKQNGYRVGSNWFHSDTSSRIQQIGLVMMGAGLPANINWKTISGSFVTMTPTLAMQIFQTTAATDMTLFAVAEAKRSAMLASSDPANFDYLSGWPQTYGE